MTRNLLLALAVFGLAACHGDHDHDHEQPAAQEHAHEESLSWTDMTSASQLHLEWPEVQIGKPASVLLHLTRVGDWKPIEGSVVLELTQGQNVQKASVKAVQPGMFMATFTPSAAGQASLTITVSGDVSAIHRGVVDLGKHAAPTGGHAHGDDHAHSDEKHDHGDQAGDDHGHDHGHGGHDHAEGIPFYLEQQWKMPFMLRTATTREVRPSFKAYGALKPRMGGEGVVHAATAGRVFAQTMPALGARVEKGDTLAWLVPSLSDQGDFASLDFAMSDARVRVRQIEAEVKRLESLVKDGVVPAKRLDDARFEFEQARASLVAAEQRSRQARGIAKPTGKGAGSVPLVAPISGVIVGIDVPAGLYVESGQALFRIVDPDPIWLEVQVPEAHVALLNKVTGVWFTVEGFEKTFNPTNPEIATGGILDPHSRTLPLIVTVPNPDGALRPGMFADVNVVEGQPRQAVTVPVSAVVYENGLPVVYTMIHAESFERRVVRLGQRDGAVVEVIEGIEPGEWVVAKGAYAVRLASLGDQEAGHAH